MSQTNSYSDWTPPEDPWVAELASLRPKPNEISEQALMYQCGFRAGQASMAGVAAGQSSRKLLWHVLAASLVGLLVGPASFYWGRQQAPMVVIQQSGEAVPNDLRGAVVAGDGMPSANDSSLPEEMSTEALAIDRDPPQEATRQEAAIDAGPTTSPTSSLASNQPFAKSPMIGIGEWITSWGWGNQQKQLDRRLAARRAEYLTARSANDWQWQGSLSPYLSRKMEGGLSHGRSAAPEHEPLSPLTPFRKGEASGTWWQSIQ